jgi:hypothetical protein
MGPFRYHFWPWQGLERRQVNVLNEYLELSVTFARAFFCWFLAHEGRKDLLCSFWTVLFICRGVYWHFNSRYIAQRHWRISNNTTHLRRMNFPCWKVYFYFIFLWQPVRSKTESWSTATSVEVRKRFYLKPLLVTRALMSFPMCCTLKCWLSSENEWFLRDF